MKRVIVLLLVLIFSLSACGEPGVEESATSSSPSSSPDSTSPSPTESPTESPAPSPTPPGLLYAEDFSTPRDPWRDDPPDSGGNSFVDGGYRISAGSRAEVWKLFWDFRVIVAAKPEAGSHGYYGLQVRLQSNQQDCYEFLISSGGGGNPGFYLNRYEQGSSTELAHDYSPAILPADGSGANRFDVTCLGGSLLFAINDTVLAEVTDYAFRSGDISLITDEITVDFSDLQIWAVEGGATAAAPLTTPGVLLADDFSQPASTWTTSEGPDQGEYSGVVDGAYHIRTDVYGIGRARQDLRDVVLQAEASVLEPGEYYSFGLLLRYRGDEECYFFGIEVSGDRKSWFFQVRGSNGRQTLKEDSFYSPLTDVKLQVTARGSHFVLSINGVRQAEVDDVEVFSGDIGFFVQGGADLTEVAFDNLLASEP